MLVSLLCVGERVSAQTFAVKVNALSALTATIDVGAEVALTNKWTLGVGSTFNPLSTEKYSFTHGTIDVGAKRWFCESYAGPFVGQHIKYIKYDISDDEKSTKGLGIGLGASYGYSWILSNRWNVTLEAGLALMGCDDVQQAHSFGDWDSEYIYYTKRITLVPSHFGVTFNYLF